MLMIFCCDSHPYWSSLPFMFNLFFIFGLVYYFHVFLLVVSSSIIPIHCAYQKHHMIGMNA